MNLKRPFSAQHFGITIFALAMLPGLASGSTLYREIFPDRLTPPASQEQQLANEGWYGGNTGDAFLGNIVGGEGAISAGGVGAAEQAAVNSNPQGISNPASSFGFWSKEGVSNNFLYTAEYSLPVASLTSVNWNSRNSSNSASVIAVDGQGGSLETDTHIALRIANNWYVSDQGFLQQGDATAWRDNLAVVSNLTWGLFDDYGAVPDFSLLPGRSSTMGAGIVGLPNGTIDGFGLWWERVSRPPGVGNGTNRIDNFTLNGTVPEPGTLALVCTALWGFALLRRRRNR
jgi:hypothetical protein